MKSVVNFYVIRQKIRLFFIKLLSKYCHIDVLKQFDSDRKINLNGSVDN